MLDVNKVFLEKNILGGLMSFMNNVKKKSLGKFTRVSDQPAKEILILLFIQLKTISMSPTERIKNLLLDNAKSVLQDLYSFINNESKNPELK
jgi:hypothetical protein